MGKNYNRISHIYDIFELPFKKSLNKYRKKLLQNVNGRTLEVGVGTGGSLPFYPRNIEIIGIDVSEKMLQKAKNRTKKQNIPVRLEIMNVEKLDFEDNYFDTVIAMCVFCTVSDPVKGLQEVRRVCKKGGTIILLEHIRSERKVLGKIMDILNPIPSWLIGDHINRRTYENLQKAGFKKDYISVKPIWSDIIVQYDIINF